jgi:lysophospholipase L1-like esterase
LTDLTVSGATLLHVLNEKQFTNGQVFDPQIQGIPSDADIVTVTCGGNDIGYIGGLSAVTKGLSPDAPTLRPEVLVARIVKVLDGIYAIAPKAKVFLVQYISVIGNQTRPLYDIALGSRNMRRFDDIAGMLAQAYVEAAAQRPDFTTVVPVAKASRDHALGSDEPWIRGWLGDMPAAYHPNVEGHRAIARLLSGMVRPQEKL